MALYRTDSGERMNAPRRSDGPGLTDVIGNHPAGDFSKDFRVITGDADGNGVVDFDDYAHIDNGFNNHLIGYSNGDFNYDGRVDFDDYSLIDFAFNTQ